MPNMHCNCLFPLISALCHEWGNTTYISYKFMLVYSTWHEFLYLAWIRNSGNFPRLYWPYGVKCYQSRVIFLRSRGFQGNPSCRRKFSPDFSLIWGIPSFLLSVCIYCCVFIWIRHATELGLPRDQCLPLCMSFYVWGNVHQGVSPVLTSTFILSFILVCFKRWNTLNTGIIISLHLFWCCTAEA